MTTNTRRNSIIERRLASKMTFGQIALKLGCTRNVVAGVAFRWRKRGKRK